jgi:hypothetical protein
MGDIAILGKQFGFDNADFEWLTHEFNPPLADFGRYNLPRLSSPVMAAG